MPAETNPNVAGERGQPPQRVVVTGAAPAGGSRRLLWLDLTATALLLVQLLLGMIANLWVTLPKHHPGTGSTDFFGGAAAAIAWVIPHANTWVAAHAALGLALVAIAIASTAISAKHGNRRHTTAVLLATVAIIGAGFNGTSFLNYGHDFSSLIMTALWTLATASYIAALLHANTRPKHTSGH